MKVRTLLAICMGSYAAACEPATPADAELLATLFGKSLVPAPENCDDAPAAGTDLHVGYSGVRLGLRQRGLAVQDELRARRFRCPFVAVMAWRWCSTSPRLSRRARPPVLGASDSRSFLAKPVLLTSAWVFLSTGFPAVVASCTQYIAKVVAAAAAAAPPRPTVIPSRRQRRHNPKRCMYLPTLSSAGEHA